MDKNPTPFGDTISANAIIHDAFATAHLVILAIVLFVCYPACYFLDIRYGSSSHSHKNFVPYATTGAILIALLSALFGCSLQPEHGQGTPIYYTLRGMLPILIVGHGSVLLLHYHHRDKHCAETNAGSTAAWRVLLHSFAARFQVLGWAFLVVIYVIYAATALLVFTESASGAILLPLLFGTSLGMYGIFIAFHIFEVISVSSTRTPEYYESFVFTIFGIACLLVSDNLIINSALQALNPGLLWTSSGLLSISINMQTWMPLLRERNVSNALALGLVGRGKYTTETAIFVLSLMSSILLAAITTASKSNDSFREEVISILGHVIILASILNAIHIVLRRSLANRVVSRQDDELVQMEQIFDQHSNREHCKHVDYCSYLGAFMGIIAASLMIAAGMLWVSTAGHWLERMSISINGPATYTILASAFSTAWTVYLFLITSIYSYLRSSGNAYYERVATSDVQPAIRHQDIDLHLTFMEDESELPSMRPSEYRAKRLSLRIHSLSGTVGQYHSVQSTMFSSVSDEPVRSISSHVANVKNLGHLDFLHAHNIEEAHLDKSISSSSSSSSEYIPNPSSPRPAAGSQ